MPGSADQQRREHCQCPGQRRGAGLNDVAAGLKSVYGSAYSTIAQGLGALTNSAGNIATALAHGAGAGLTDVAGGLKTVFGAAYSTIAQGLTR